VARVSEMFLKADRVERSDDPLPLGPRDLWTCSCQIHQKSSLDSKTTFVREMSHDRMDGCFVFGGQVRFRSA
jgi:hypothetical protein